MGDVLRARCGEKSVKLSGPPWGYHSPSTSIGFTSLEAHQILLFKGFWQHLHSSPVPMLICGAASSSPLITWSFCWPAPSWSYLGTPPYVALLILAQKGLHVNDKNTPITLEIMSLRSLVPGTGNKVCTCFPSCSVAQLWLTLSDPLDCSPPGSTSQWHN